MMVVTSPMGAPAAVGGDDDHAGEYPPLLFVGDKPSQQHDHDDRGGHIIQRRRHEEGDYGEQPHQLALVARGDVVGDDAESPVTVDQVHDGHGADQEDQYLAGVAQLIDQFVLDLGVVAQEAEDSPDGSGHEQRDGRFVDFRFVLERDEQVAHHEKQNHCRYHSVRIIKSTMVAKLINCPVFRLSNWAFFEVRIGFWDFFIYLCRRFRANV